MADSAQRPTVDERLVAEAERQLDLALQDRAEVLARFNRGERVPYATQRDVEEAVQACELRLQTLRAEPAAPKPA